eukprot:3431107-Rhodomonas_salina.2
MLRLRSHRSLSVPALCSNPLYPMHSSVLTRAALSVLTPHHASSHQPAHQCSARARLRRELLVCDCDRDVQVEQRAGGSSALY